MADDPRPSDDPIPEFLARTRPPLAPAPGAESCPDAGLLAGFAEGRLTASEVDALEAHLIACEACRSAVAAIAFDDVQSMRAAPVLAATRPVRRLRPWMFAAAAAAVFVAALFVAGPGRDGGATREALVASARDLASARPDLFRGFEPLAAGESVSSAPGPKRGAMALLSPAGKLIETKPAFRWEAIPGVTRWRVELFTADGESLWTAETSEPSLAFPVGRAALRPGTRYLWEASGDGPFGREGSRRAFDVASDEERAALDDATRVIAERVPARLRPLVLAHVALRRGLYSVAESEASRFLEAAPGDAVGEETLASARRALGESSAGREKR